VARPAAPRAADRSFDIRVHPRLHAEAAAIRARLAEGVIGPAATAPAMQDVDIDQRHTEGHVADPVQAIFDAPAAARMMAAS